MSNLIEKVLATDIPLIDVRAPIEFKEGHFPSSVNLPILTDQERQEVGTCYKKEGREQAIVLGNRLVSGETKEKRMKLWGDFKKQNTNAMLYCFRGGLRSQIAQKWLKEQGIEIEIIPGGYKAMRQFLIQSLEQSSQSLIWTVVGGMTGTGKTEFLNSVASEFNVLDLESIANHRGSSFGSLGEQPTQIDFENQIAIQLLKLKVHPQSTRQNRILVESESKLIGKRKVPDPIYHQIISAPLVVLEATLEERVERILNQYILNSPHSYEHFKQSLAGIRMRLGLMEYQQVSEQMSKAFLESNLELHRDWISRLLIKYYDPLYLYSVERSLKENKDRKIFKGDLRACKEFLLSKSQFS